MNIIFQSIILRVVVMSKTLAEPGINVHLGTIIFVGTRKSSYNMKK